MEYFVRKEKYVMHKILENKFIIIIATTARQIKNYAKKEHICSL